MFASDDASLFPRLKRPPPPAVLPSGLPGVVLGAPDVAPAPVAPNKLGAEDEVVAGFEPNRFEVCGVAPDWAPNKLVPGGGPAGVVEGRTKVLFCAGVAAGVEPILTC